ncbi:MAG: response regulator [Anaerolineae bacterium]|nr:response regulator [Anaerolineae bacterium]
MNGSSVHVLVVDDEAMIRRNLCAFLEDEGFTVFPAASSEAALQLLENHHTDVGVIDIRLSGMDGNTFVLRAHALYPYMKFLIHTGSSDYQVPAELAAIGVQPEDVFMKPVADMRKIAQAIRRLVI